ncbi:hypothetical protein FH972_026029 [Carpinus fangiana]|uniref:Uncharacterized protein n=1 Tax=Carpinus fangiana TaxID=176857 RepID=A0A5N6L2Z3_9ROSI|nr:hypothetical protein FH972_026029 [Carpinus fangiana]
MPARASFATLPRCSTILKITLAILVALYVLSHVAATPSQVVMDRKNTKHSKTTFVTHTSTDTLAHEVLSGDGESVFREEGPVQENSSNPWAITYTPYTSAGACKTAQEILADVDEIAAAGFLAIRLYSTDCKVLTTHDLAETLRENEMGLVLGVHVSSGGLETAYEQIDDILAFREPGVIQMVVVGNDAIFNEYCKPEELIGLLKRTKSALSDIGYDGPITTTEPIAILNEHKEQLCPHLDVLASNIQPFFDAGCAAQDAGQIVAQHLQVLGSICGHTREAWNLETGWPSKGSEAHHRAVPGTTEQMAAVRSIWKEAGSRSAFHAFEDEMWKDEGVFGVEQYWGCMNIFSPR